MYCKIQRTVLLRRQTFWFTKQHIFAARHCAINRLRFPVPEHSPALKVRSIPVFQESQTLPLARFVLISQFFRSAGEISANQKLLTLCILLL